jgi:hypothetical protein
MWLEGGQRLHTFWVSVQILQEPIESRDRRHARLMQNR